MLLFLLFLNMAMFGVFCSVLYLLSPPILMACLGAMAAYGLWTLVDALCQRAPRLSQK
jgi:predicted PurR-regulated permease PerM